MELRAKIEAIKEIIDKKREEDTKAREKEVEFLQSQSDHLKRFLKQIE